MDPVMRELFFQIIDHTLVNYYSMTGYYERESNRDKLCRQLEDQLTPDQRQLFDEIHIAYGYVQNSELEAVFLAAYDQLLTILRPKLAI